MSQVPFLKDRLASGGVAYSGWISSSEAANGAAIASAGYDAVTVDLQHGVSGIESMNQTVAAVAQAGAAPLVRIPLFDAGLAGRALDSGAQAIIAPMINSAEDAEWLARAGKFPPIGERSWGPARACALYGMSLSEMLKTANDWILTLAMIETRAAVDAMDLIMTTEGIDGVFVGPSDLSISLSNGAQIKPDDPETMKVCERIAATAQKNGVHAAGFAMTKDMAHAFRDMGFDLIVPGSDVMMLKQGASAILSSVKES